VKGQGLKPARSRYRLVRNGERPSGSRALYPEFGVRLAIGAKPSDLISDVLGGSARLVLPGLIIGILLAAGVARLVRFALYGVNVLNPVADLAVALLECVIVAVACVGPALRASRVDPIAALRAE
jgi:putative ABC transport system permease protein